MLGCRSRFVARVKEVAPRITNTHCMIHREALASNTLPASLNDVLKDVIQMVNFVQASAYIFYLHQTLVCISLITIIFYRRNISLEEKEC